MSDTTLLVARPAMFRNSPVGFTVLALLSLVVVGIPFLLVWYLRCRGTALTITNQRTILRRGLLSKATSEVLHKNIRNVQTRQTIMQRLFGVGYLGIASAGTAGIEIEVDGIPNPDGIRKLIDQNRG